MKYNLPERMTDQCADASSGAGTIHAQSQEALERWYAGLARQDRDGYLKAFRYAQQIPAALTSQTTEG